MNSDSSRKKLISIIVAVRNEEGYIDKCLDSLLDQSFPVDQYEIIVVDGRSDDRTREIVGAYTKKFSKRIRFLDNPKRIQAAGRNIAIRNSCSEIIVYIDGHSFAERHYLSKIFSTLSSEPSNTAGVGGVHFPPKDEGNFGRLLWEVQNTLLGGAGTSYRQGKSRYVDTVAFCAYRRNVFERVGLYDESLEAGEDVELNWRIRKAGFRLKVRQDAVVYYYRRYNSISLLFSRMLKYGFWRAAVTKKHPESFKIIFLFPIMVVLSLITLPFFIIIYYPMAFAILLGLIMYVITVSAVSLMIAANHRNLSYLLSFVIYFGEHFGIGLGFIIGFLVKADAKSITLK